MPATPFCTALFQMNHEALPGGLTLIGAGTAHKPRGLSLPEQLRVVHLANARSVLFYTFIVRFDAHL